GQSMAKLLEAIDEPNCRANWDPANHWVYRHESFSAGYEALRKHISHVHVKDHLPGEGRHQTVPPGHGQVGWPGQVRTLIEDGYDGLMVVETHFTPRIAGSRACVEALRDILRDVGEVVE
ncbi:MAG: TIM barrel protein, partial [Armatimonadota bacterium]|nr:TIM barrel protein [Armatimonadota bacterium]